MWVRITPRHKVVGKNGRKIIIQAAPSVARNKCKDLEKKIYFHLLKKFFPFSLTTHFSPARSSSWPAGKASSAHQQQHTATTTQISLRRCSGCVRINVQPAGQALNRGESRCDLQQADYKLKDFQWPSVNVAPDIYNQRAFCCSSAVRKCSQRV